MRPHAASSEPESGRHRTFATTLVKTSLPRTVRGKSLSPKAPIWRSTLGGLGALGSATTRKSPSTGAKSLNDGEDVASNDTRYVVPAWAAIGSPPEVKLVPASPPHAAAQRA